MKTDASKQRRKISKQLANCLTWSSLELNRLTCTSSYPSPLHRNLEDMKLVLLNGDSSWLWQIHGSNILVDPWFSDSQVDFFPWFSEQFHTSPQPNMAELPFIDYIFISHPFTDHCNKETLLRFRREIPIICTSYIAGIIQGWKHFTTILQLTNSPFNIELISKPSLLDPVHGAYLITLGEHTICYAPHGIKALQRDNIKCDVCIITTTEYQLPFYLGGTVNLGLSSALLYADLLCAKYLLSTHDEQKRQSGLVAILSKRIPPQSHSKVQALQPLEFLEL